MATAPMESLPKPSVPSAPPVDAADYYRVKMSNKGDSIKQIADKLGISVEQAQGFETKLAALIPQIISEAKEELQADAHRNFLNTGDEFLKGGKYRKSRRHSKKSRRHAKKSRRHAKKSRRSRK
jgi:hypothetical protein